jgi:hypothetical protein
MSPCNLSILLLASPLFAVQIPAGAELEIRLTGKIASETVRVNDPVPAVLIAPIMVDGRVALPLMARVTGEVKQTRAASDAGAALLEIVFNRISAGNYSAAMSAVVTSVENARETVDQKGVITGIDTYTTYGGRLNQGISRLGNDDRFAALATILQTAKRGLQIEDVDPNIDYDAGAELRLKLTASLEWQGPTAGPESRLQPFPNESALVDLVNREPFRTTAQSPARPSDITNLMFIATEDELRAAFSKAGWFPASHLSAESKLETARALIEDRGYREGPMSILTLNGEPPAMSWQKGNNTFSSRHHLRVFVRPQKFAGKPVWVCSSTHDIGIDFSDRDRTFIHKIDSNIDKERAKVVDDLLGTGMIRSLAIVDRSDIPQHATNATGDALHTDGRMAVLLIQQ